MVSFILMKKPCRQTKNCTKIALIILQKRCEIFPRKMMIPVCNFDYVITICNTTKNMDHPDANADRVSNHN